MRRALLVVCLLVPSSLAIEEEPCEGGSCPATQFMSSSSISNTGSCELWMAPSPIKKAEEHGFGLGMFTGKLITAGTVVEDSIFGSGEVLIPLYGSETIYESHPPLREYLWDEDMVNEVAVEDPSVLTALFMPGLSAIAPCTSNDFNLKLAPNPPHDLHTDIHRSHNPVAGAISYRHVIGYTAVRDIFPGEELTLECSDDTFPGGNYFLSRYEPTESTVCLDHLKVQATPKLGKGLFTKKGLPKDSTILSTPVIPIHRSEMNIFEDNINSLQLLLNYCYGNEHSDVLLLPFAPMINAMNHNDTVPNAKLKWHETTQADPLHRRQQYHHEELLEQSAEYVANAHGMSLAIDVVALRDIAPDEEITIDYGPQWKAAWEAHVKNWKAKEPSYQTADQFLAEQAPGTPIRTQQEQTTNPYPHNFELFCKYSVAFEDTGGEEVLRTRFMEDAPNECLRPCQVLERDGAFYTVLLRLDDNERILPHCLIDSDYVISHTPHSAIELLDRPYSTDVFLPDAFRHEIHVDFFPKTWMRQKLRRPAGRTDTTQGDEFKRKAVYEVEE